MKIKSFQIKNYKSIVDSGECFFSGDNITILAGKNESGKTAILEALQDFNVDKIFNEDTKPIYDEDLTPEINIIFIIEKQKINEIFKILEVEESYGSDMEIKIKKTYPNEYDFDESTLELMHLNDEKFISELMTELVDYLKELKNMHDKYPHIGGNWFEAKKDDRKKDLAKFQETIEQIKQNIPSIPNPDEQQVTTKLIDKITKKIQELQKWINIVSRFIDEIKKDFPNFILFRSFNDILPSEILITEAENNELIQDLSNISELNFGLIKSDNRRRKAKHKKDINLIVNEDYKKYWNQDETDISIDWDKDTLECYIEESGETYTPAMRSKGKQWHLSFYIRITARSKEDVPNIILIDEPGLFLHAKAQEDILKNLVASSMNTPIVFSTHSPYLIDTNQLHRIRLISRNSPSEGTKISNKIHKGADKETITPIITAIGLDLSMGLDIGKDNNIIVEGISDYYYLQSFIDISAYKFKKEIHIIPCVGADKTKFIVPLMIGWGLNYCVLLDNDNQGKKVRERLEKDFSHLDIKIIRVSGEDNYEIEDLFDKSDFVDYVLKGEIEPILDDKRVSQILKQKGTSFDKVLLSKSFYENREEIKGMLSIDTKERFKGLLASINESLFPNEEEPEVSS